APRLRVPRDLEKRTHGPAEQGHGALACEAGDGVVREQEKQRRECRLRAADCSLRSFERLHGLWLPVRERVNLVCILVIGTLVIGGVAALELGLLFDLLRLSEPLPYGLL